MKLYMKWYSMIFDFYRTSNESTVHKSYFRISSSWGPQLRIQNSILALSRIVTLDIIHRASVVSPETNKTDSFFSQYSNQYTTLWSSSTNRIFNVFSKVFHRLAPFQTPKHGRFFVDYIKSNDIDVVWFGYGNISYSLIRYVRQKLPNIRIVCDTDSVWSRFVLRDSETTSLTKNPTYRFQEDTGGEELGKSL